MSHDDPRSDSRPKNAGPAACYEPPAIAWEEAIDVRATLVAACLKISTDEPCDTSTAS
jgi:hypothetical protein